MIAVVVKAFFMFLMMRCSGYARVSRMRVRLLKSSCRTWSSEMIMLCLGIDNTFFTAEWMVIVEVKY